MQQFEQLTNTNELLEIFQSINIEKITISILKYLIVILIIITIIYSITSIANYKILKKANRKGWKAFIPFLNTYEIYEITGISGYLFLTIFIPIIGPIIHTTIKTINKVKLSQKFEKDNIIYQIGLILLPWIFLPILAFSDTKYIDNDKI